MNDWIAVFTLGAVPSESPMPGKQTTAVRNARTKKPRKAGSLYKFKLGQEQKDHEVGMV